jgi:hypothetical protein
MRDLQDTRRQRSPRREQLRLDPHADIRREQKYHFVDHDSQYERAFIA